VFPEPLSFISKQKIMQNFYLKSVIILALFSITTLLSAQHPKPQIWDPELNQYVSEKAVNKERELRYTPVGEDFVIVNGTKKFNRALYGTHTGFRVETGDIPEFALYLPRMGGNLSFSFGTKKETKALNNAKRIESRYRAGSRIYTIADPLLNDGSIKITVLAMSQAEGMIIKLETSQIPSDMELGWIFGGAADKRFSREGDLGVDPEDCFDLKPEYCKGNKFSIDKNSFNLIFGAKNDRKLIGTFPANSALSLTEAPTLKGSLPLKNNATYYFAIQIPDNGSKTAIENLPELFSQSESDRAKIASQIKITTPDPYLNTLGSTLSIATDGIWSSETWLHGAVGWRMPLSGWRAAYAGDALGWHDRARLHFDAYAASQVTNVEPTRPHPNQDAEMNLARAEKSWGTQMYSNGYICRNPHENNKMHHYDMNLCYIDELLWHLNWTGNFDYARKIWPVIERDLAWEKRNFDPDNDGLYDAYCCIWASDGLYYNSGAVTHSSAYNYRANKIAAEIAGKIGINPAPYANEADKILKAMNGRLWISSKGHWAEFQDFMGEKKIHESAALWTIYHAIDSETQDAFQGYQATRYVDTEIPHIPVVAKGLKDEGYATLATSNWMPYCWSTNNVVNAEVLHTSLAYWQAGRNEEACKLLKSSVLDAMYLGGSPGNVSQISFYDAARGECYRDFGDPIGVMSRALVQGLFGILPDAMNNKVLLRPGFPQLWNHASISTSDIDFSFERVGKKEIYAINQHFQKKLTIELQVKAYYDSISSVKVNGKNASWKLVETAGEYPVISITTTESGKIEIDYAGHTLDKLTSEQTLKYGDHWEFNTHSFINKAFNPQQVVSNIILTKNSLTGKISGTAGHRTLFVQLTQGQMTWWQPINIEVSAPAQPITKAFSEVNASNCEQVNIDPFFNDFISHIFENKYLSPRSPYTTLQIPTQGIGEWCHPKETAEIDDSGLRKIVTNGLIETKLGVSFRTPATGKNIAFTSQWDNFPKKIEIPLTGSASHAYLLMAGTTNQMQTHFVNGKIEVEYTDGSRDSLELINPENWCPIEQDYFVDGKAFQLNAPRPYRLHLKTGLVSNDLEKDLKIKGVYGRKINGGAGILLDMPLNKSKKLKKLKLITVANEVIIGLMSLTLQR
jgi:hypothetical protein